MDETYSLNQMQKDTCKAPGVGHGHDGTQAHSPQYPGYPQHLAHIKHSSVFAALTNETKL